MKFNFPKKTKISNHFIILSDLYSYIMIFQKIVLQRFSHEDKYEKFIFHFRKIYNTNEFKIIKQSIKIRINSLENYAKVFAPGRY